MKKLALTFLFIMLASPAWATTFFLAPASSGGNDSNSGTSPASPWLSPNHSVNCGDTIVAASSTAYSASNFGSGNWGAVSCPSGNNVAWLVCASFDACKINAAGQDGMRVSANFWGVQGWEVTTSAGGGACFTARAPGTSTIHHIIFANNVANGCQQNGFNSYNSGNASVDYLVIVGNAAYNAASGSGNCYSGISIYQPQNADTLSGTHIYVAGNFSWSNLDPSPCAGTAPTDGEGIILDTFDGSQGGLAQYTQQAVVYNNIVLSNGGRGIQILNNRTGSSNATIFSEFNTAWGDNTDTHQNGTYCGEHLISFAKNTTSSHNIGVTNAANGCGSNPIYAFYVGSSDASDSVTNNWIYSPSGTNEGVNNSSGFSFGSGNVVGTNPNFTSPSVPGAPSCGSATSVPNCMATVIANFTPTTAAAKSFGYQIPSTSPTVNSLFPQWLCNVNLPAGLVTMGCASSTSLPVPPTNINATVN